MQGSAAIDASYGITLPNFIAPFLTNHLSNVQVENINNKPIIKIQLKDQPKPVVLTTYSFAEIDQTKRNEYVKIQDKNRVVVFAKIDDLSTLLKCDRNMMALQARAGNLEFILSIAKNFSHKNVVWKNKLEAEVERLVFIKGAVNGNCSSDHLEKIKKWCEENKIKLNEELKNAKALDPFVCYIVVKKAESKLPYNFEFRSDDDIRIHLQKNAARGSILLLSKHLALLTGNKVNKLKGCISGYLYQICSRRFTSVQVVRISALLNLIPDVEGVVKHVFAPEVVKKNTCLLTNGVRYYRYVEDLDIGTFYDYYFRTKRNIEFKECCRLASELCLILDRLHKQGVLHRDITLDNIMYQTDEVTGMKVPKINDFDLADFLDQEQIVGKGNPSYVDTHIMYLVHQNAKKYPADQKVQPVIGKVDTKPDMYSLGVVIFDLLVRRIPVINDKFVDKICDRIIDKQGNYNEGFVHACQGQDRLSLMKFPQAFRDHLMSMMHPIPEQRPLLSDAAKVFLGFSNEP